MEQTTLEALIELGKNLRVLYVEDDKALQAETKKILDRIFARVDVASDGLQALERFKMVAYDLVITDIEMPYMNGMELSQEIKKINPKLPIVVISAYSNTEYLIKAIGIGINYYVLKPIKMEELINTLHRVAEHINNEKIAEVFRQKELNDKIATANNELLSELIGRSPNPVLVYKENQLYFMNSAFKELFSEDDIYNFYANPSIEDFLNKKISLDLLLKEKGELVEHLDAPLAPESGRFKISIATSLGRKIFLMIRSELQMSEQEPCVMFTLNDITLIEYQRIQIDQYEEYMSDLTYKKYKVSTKNDLPAIINKTVFE